LEIELLEALLPYPQYFLAFFDAQLFIVKNESDNQTTAFFVAV